MGPSEELDFHQSTALFLQWLKQLKGAYRSPKIEITDLRYRKAGRGIVATENIQENEILFSISNSHLLTVSTSTLQQRISRRALQDQLDNDPWMCLILTMIYEVGRGVESKWWPYLNILPTEFDTLMYWSEAELAELQGSSVLGKIGKDDADASFRRILLPVVKENAGLFGDYASTFANGGPEAERVLLDVAHRMASLIMAYAFDLDPEEEDGEGDEGDEEDDCSALDDLPKALIPVADLFNADGTLDNAHLIQNGTTMTMVASTSIKKGQEIFNDYGRRPRSDLLRRYGYITDNAKKWDVVELDVETIVETARELRNLDEREMERRLELAKEWQVYEDGYDLHRPQGKKASEFDPALRLMIYACVMDQETFEKEMKVKRVPDKAPFDIDTALLLRKIFIQRRDLYRTSIAEDITLLQNNSVEGRTRMAIEVRLGEKEILAAALDSVGSFIVNHRPELSVTFSSGDNTMEMPTTKRRRI